MQDWAKEPDIEWRSHLLYNLQAVGLIERKNGILKKQIKLLIGKTTFAGWTKALSQALKHLKVQPVGPVAPYASLRTLPRHQHRKGEEDSHCPDASWIDVLCC